MGVTVPRIEVKEDPAPESKRSMWPLNAHKEAGTKVSLSLGFVGALMFGAYQLGSQRARDAETVAAEVAGQKTECALQKTACDAARSECSSSVRSITATDGRIASMQAELVTINSKLEKR
jgi:hypothetical protein